MLGPIIPFQLMTVPRRWQVFAFRVILFACVYFVMWIAQFNAISNINRSYHTYTPLTHPRFPAMYGEMFFRGLIVLQSIALAFFIPAQFGGTIAVERERRTMDYLLASSLSSWEIIVGKWLVRLLQTVYLLLGFVAIVAIIRVQGGIEFSQLIMLFATNFALSVSLSAACVLISTCNRSARLAIFRCYMLMILVSLVSLLMLVLTFMPVGMNPVAGYVTDFLLGIDHFAGPFSQYQRLYDPHDAETLVRDLVWPTIRFMMMHVGIGAILLAMACFYLRRVHLERSITQKKSERLRPARNASSMFPLAWREWYFPGISRIDRRVSIIASIVIILLVFTPFVLVVTQFRTQIGVDVSLLRDSYKFCLWIGYMLAALAILVRASTTVGVERDRDTWISILASPLSNTQIVLGKFIGAIKIGVGAILVILPLLIICWLVGAISFLSILCVIGSMLVGFALTSAIGIHVSFSYRNTTTALTLGIVGFLIVHGFGQIFENLIFNSIYSWNRQILLPEDFPGHYRRQTIHNAYSSWFCPEMLVAQSLFDAKDPWTLKVMKSIVQRPNNQGWGYDFEDIPVLPMLTNVVLAELALIIALLVFTIRRFCYSEERAMLRSTKTKG